MQLFQIFIKVFKKTKKNMQKGNTVRHYKTNKHSGMLFTSFFSFMDVADHLFEYVCVCVWDALPVVRGQQRAASAGC